MAARPRIGQTEMRSANIALLLEHLRAVGECSRRELCDVTGLSRASMANLVGLLVEAGLVTQSEPRATGGVGRPGQLLRLDGAHICGIGAELTADHLVIAATDLRGITLGSRTLHVPDVADVDAVLAFMADELLAEIRARRDAGAEVCGVCLAVHGVLRDDDGVVHLATTLGWRDVGVRDALLARWGGEAPALHVENDAKLAARAEFDRRRGDGVTDLVYLTGQEGVGAGIIAGSRLLRGRAGLSGEVGHLPLDALQRPCECGRRGCWEKAVGVWEFLDLAHVVAPPGVGVTAALDQLRIRLDRGDRAVLSALHTIAAGLVPGVQVLLDILNPDVVVLGGYFSLFADHLLPELTTLLSTRRIDDSSEPTLAGSDLGMEAAALGGAAVSIQRVFTNPALALASTD